MSIINLVPKTAPSKPNISEVLAWLDRTKENAEEYGITNIAIAYVCEDGSTGSGYIAYQSAALLGALDILHREILDSSYE